MRLTDQLRDELEARRPLIQLMIAGVLRSAERRHNAMCWACEYWPAAVAACPNLDAAAVSAARYGAMQRRTYGHIGKQGRQDAADHAEPLAAEPVAPADSEPSPRQLAAAKLLANGPDKLRPVASLLANGQRKTEIAATLGLHRDTVRVRCDAIADWLLAQTA
jgi:hypothetical protein